jgi:hypothetical protein
LSGKFVCCADDSGFSDALVEDQSGLDFGGTQTMTGNVDNVVDTTADPVEPFVISSSTVTRELSLAEK